MMANAIYGITEAHGWKMEKIPWKYRSANKSVTGVAHNSKAFQLQSNGTSVVNIYISDRAQRGSFKWIRCGCTAAKYWPIALTHLKEKIANAVQHMIEA